MNGEKTDVSWLSDMDALEPYCIAVRKNGAIVYLYPFVREIAALGCKCVTRDGRTARNVRMGSRRGVDVVVGTVGGEEYQWDEAGRHTGPYVDSPLDLYIPERYFDRHNRRKMKMSNTEWQLRYGRPHPGVKIPEVKPNI